MRGLSRNGSFVDARPASRRSMLRGVENSRRESTTSIPSRSDIFDTMFFGYARSSNARSGSTHPAVCVERGPRDCRRLSAKHAFRLAGR